MDKKLPDIFIIPDCDHSKITVCFTSLPEYTNLHWSVMDGTELFSKGLSSIKPNNKICFDIDMFNFIPWSPEHPCLYTLKLKFSGNYDNLEVSKHFGMRKFSIEGKQIYLNNQPLFIRGYIRGRDAHDHPNLLNLPPAQFYAKNIRMAKELGFNFVRFHSRVPSKEFFEAADELGMLIQIELRNYDAAEHNDFLTDQGQMLDKQRWIQIIQALRNHPSLMVYCMGCEIPNNGKNPYTLEIYNLVKQMDPTRIFLDSCARGEFDRSATDIDVQHMSYFYPYGKNRNMFEDCYNWSVNGSTRDLELVAEFGQQHICKIKRNLCTSRPIIAHEICHYTALHDLDSLEQKFSKANQAKPWWLDELKKLVNLKHLENDYPMMFKASRHFQFLSWKLGLEAARMSKLLCGFHFLQLSDTEKYENSNGLLDCFDDPQSLTPEKFLQFNGPTVILADLPLRTFFEKEFLQIPVVLSHFDSKIKGTANFSFTLYDKIENKIIASGQMEKFDMNKLGRYEICRVEVELPAAAAPKALSIIFNLSNDAKTFKIENSWDIWVYPNRALEIAPLACTFLADINIAGRYPQIKSCGSAENPQKLIIANHFSKEIFNHMSDGGDVLMLYRVGQTRDRKTKAQKEKYYLPTTWDRFKAVIWDRGTNCGGFIRQSNALNNFPHQDFIDMQFCGLIDDCDKIVLDDFPCDIEPIIQGVDKAARDRFDVHTYKLRGLQPKWTLRKFAYMFEIRVGRGRLFVTGFNFTKLSEGIPEVCAMFESIIKYISSDSFAPKTSINPDELEDYLLRKGEEPAIKERKMTQFWQLDEEPLESQEYWHQAEQYIDESPC